MLSLEHLHAQAEASTEETAIHLRQQSEQQQALIEQLEQTLVDSELQAKDQLTEQTLESAALLQDARATAASETAQAEAANDTVTQLNSELAIERAARKRLEQNYLAERDNREAIQAAEREAARRHHAETARITAASQNDLLTLRAAMTTSHTNNIAELEAEVERLRALLKEYREKTPLGHQPHQIAARVDAALAPKGSDE